ncbi:MAG: hypothetical protein JWO22_2888 [Frankiales bacterium]|nr:hypothetical protein [Frankiales bacterium]
MGKREDLHALVGETTLQRLPMRLCEVGCQALGVDGVGIALTADAQAHSLLATCGDFVGSLEAIQFSLGEGPCLDAHGSGRPAMEPDVSGVGRTRWPLFADAALDLGVAAVFAFPLQAGASRFGVLDAARGRAGPLSVHQLEDAICLAELASEAVLLLQQADNAGNDTELGSLSSERVVVHQATGMVSAQAGLNVGDALAWLRARAYSTGLPLEDVASDVVGRRTRFGPP